MIGLWQTVIRLSRESEEGRRSYQVFVDRFRHHGPRELWQTLFVDFAEQFLRNNGRLPVVADFYSERQSVLVDKSLGDIGQNYLEAGYGQRSNPWYVADLEHLLQVSEKAVRVDMLTAGSQRSEWTGAQAFLDDYLRAHPQAQVKETKASLLLYATDAVVALTRGEYGFDTARLAPYIADHFASFVAHAAAALGQPAADDLLRRFCQQLSLLEYDEWQMQQHAASVEDARVLKQTVIDVCRQTIERG